MYNQIKKDITQDYYQTNYSNDGQRFVAWYLRNIYNLNEVQAKECVTDGTDDKQIDAVFIDIDSAAVRIIQGKFYEGPVDAEPVREILSSWTQIKDLAELQEGANAKLRSKIPEMSQALNDDGYELIFELILPTALTSSAEHDFNVFKDQISESEVLPAELELVDGEILKARYEESLQKSRPYINHSFQLEKGKYLELDIAGTKAVIVAMPLKECVKIPGIKDGTLFRKNVRQSLGVSNKVNKGIARTLKKDRKDFFFLHNGITAICSRLELKDDKLNVHELNVVNGCQSLSTIFSTSEVVRNTNDGYILFRFYEIADNSKCDLISTSTNSQSAVRARDLRSNDPAVLAIKKAFEQKYSDGYFVTKRGEEQTLNMALYNKDHIAYLTDLGKTLVAWHSQRPIRSYSESTIFDKYFSQLFKKDYSPENVLALKKLFDAVSLRWEKENPLGFNDTLLAMKAYVPFHHLYAVSYFFCTINQTPTTKLVPDPALSLDCLEKNGLLDKVVDMAGRCLNNAFRLAQKNVKDGKVFSPQNWVKNKSCLIDIQSAIDNRIGALEDTDDGQVLLQQLKKGMKLPQTAFTDRWSAD